MIGRTRVPRDLRAWNDHLSSIDEAAILVRIEQSERIERWKERRQYAEDHPELRALFGPSSYTTDNPYLRLGMYEPPRPIDLQRIER